MESFLRLTELFRLNPLQKSALERLGILTVSDLLLYLPSRYEAQGERMKIGELKAGDNAIIYGKVLSTKIGKAYYKKIPISEATIEDETGKMKAVWFHQAYMAKKLAEGSSIELRGKVTERKGELYLANPEVAGSGGGWKAAKESLFYDEKNLLETAKGHTIIPVYPETKGLSSGWFYYHIKELILQGWAEKMIDPLPKEMLEKYHLPELTTALTWIHIPRKIENTIAARKRFSFEEVLFLQLNRLKQKKTYQANPAFRVKTNKKEMQEFLSRFPFKPTGAQLKAISQISEDLSEDKPMVRLLEGDVGSGKTAVAASAAFTIVKAGLEVAYMAPTEILAKQHFESFVKYFEHLGIQVGLITGKECRKFPSKVNAKESTPISKSQLLKWVATGQIPILVGTHALIQKKVKFKNLALAIIDEQHRFGVMQRAKLVNREDHSKPIPHLLSMTATPIPRTLALTVYGDLDLTLLDELPAGRRPIITKIISPDKREEAYEHLRGELAAGRQAYVICPRIDEPDPAKELALQAKSARAEAKRLQEKIFPEFTVGLMHSKLKPKDKEETMEEFSKGEIQILVSTSVVEVGVNVPNATLIIIEGAERFGLAQLHQLRGRVLRSSHQAYCFLFSETKSEKSLERLKALVEAKNGFELAELDLSLRGAGTITGEKQWGLSDIGMEAIKNVRMVEAARTEAQALLNQDPELENYPLIKEKVRPTQVRHFE